MLVPLHGRACVRVPLQGHFARLWLRVNCGRASTNTLVPLHRRARVRVPLQGHFARLWLHPTDTSLLYKEDTSLSQMLKNRSRRQRQYSGSSDASSFTYNQRTSHASRCEGGGARACLGEGGLDRCRRPGRKSELCLRWVEVLNSCQAM